MLLGFFFPLVMVVGLGLLLGIIILLREIRKMTGAPGNAGSREPPPFAGQSPAQELGARYKQYTQDVEEREPETTANEVQSAGGSQWRW
jgi:hypothetical protein